MSCNPILREITGDANLLEQVYILRVSAWRTQATIDSGIVEWRDRFDQDGRHWAFICCNAPVAAVRLTIHDNVLDIPDAEVFDGILPADTPLPIASYNRMVVHPSHRGMGLSSRLDEVSISAARDMGAACLVGSTGSVHGNKRRVESMLRLGFNSCGCGNSYARVPYVPDSAPTVLILNFNHSIQ